MLENWFKPLSSKHFELKKNTFGESVHFFKKGNTLNSKIAIIGVDTDAANLIRKELFEYKICATPNFVTDFGNLRNRKPDFLIGALKEIIEASIIPIIIGANDDFVQSQFKSYQDRKKLPTATVVDAYLRYGIGDDEKGFLNSILESKEDTKNLFHLSALANQSHLINTEVWDLLDNHGFDLIRLGMMRSKMEEIEPLIRESDGMAFHINAIREADAPAQLNATPSGLTCEEACQVARYAGLSDKLSSIGFYGFNSTYDINKRSAKCIAQMVWYFIDGVNNRKNDYPMSLDNMTEYLVEIKGFGKPFTFWKSNKTQRWWLQIPDEKKQQNRLFSCSYSDYQLACSGELPERIWNGIKRFA